MENYNLTAEIKKISGAINNSSPNTELGNINGSVGNLDTAMQGVATAIGNISIPNTSSNIDGVATAIGNISIPNPNTNIASIATAINNKTIPDNTSNITAVANAITNKSIPDPNTQLGNIVTALNNLSGMFGGKFYHFEIYNYSTSGTWGNYTTNVRQFSLPAGAYGVGKTFMLVHHVRVEDTKNANIESFIKIASGGGYVTIPRFYHRMHSDVWTSFNHIAFINSDSNPIISFNVSTNVAVTNHVSSYCVLVPLN